MSIFRGVLGIFGVELDAILDTIALPMIRSDQKVSGMLLKEQMPKPLGSKCSNINPY